MKEKKIELGDVFFVFTNFGLSRGKVIKIEETLLDSSNVPVDGEIPCEDNIELQEWSVKQYKLNLINLFNEGDNDSIRYGFWYSEDQLFDNPDEAIKSVKEIWEIK